MQKEERKNRIVARGEHSNHCHVIVGNDVTIERDATGNILIEVGNSGAVIRHLLEDAWNNGTETWTKEHDDIQVDPGKYKYVPQLEYHPYTEGINKVKD